LREPGAEHSSACSYFENNIPRPDSRQPQHSLGNRLAVLLGETSALVESGGLRVKSDMTAVHLII
jgi:hypothetical protein